MAAVKPTWSWHNGARVDAACATRPGVKCSHCAKCLDRVHDAWHWNDLLLQLQSQHISFRLRDSP